MAGRLEAILGPFLTSGSLGRRGPLALGIYALMAALTCVGAQGFGRPEAWLAVVVVLPAALYARHRPMLVGVALIAGGLWLRLIYMSFPETMDQLAVSRAAADVVLSGGNPYAVAYAASVPPGAPFPYGPLSLVGAPLGLWGELVAAAATMALLAWARCWLTLAAYSSFFLAIELTTSGGNDVAPGLFLAVGMVCLARRQLLIGGVLLAVAAAFKPYALAWFPGAVAHGGLAALAGMVGGSLLLWAPVLVWGPLAYWQAIERAREVHPISENALNMPHLRVLALPLAVAAFFLRRWSHAVVLGLVIFAIVLFLDYWASLGYLLAAAPLVGLLLEWPDKPDGVTGAGGRLLSRLRQPRLATERKP